MILDAIAQLKASVHESPIGRVPGLEWFCGSVIDLFSGPFTGLRTRSYWPELVAALVIAGIVFMIRDRKPGQYLAAFGRYCFPRAQFIHQSTWVDCKLILANHFVTPVTNFTWRLNTVWFTTLLLSAMTATFGPAPQSHEWTTTAIVLFTILFALAEDFGYFLFHLASHRIGWMWAFHKVHHSAETLQVFANVRVHPVEVMLTGPFKALTGAFVMAPALYFWAGDVSFTTILGMNLMAAFYGFVGGQLHHCHIWISWGRVLEHIFISPAQHQIHHSTQPQHWDRNMGGNFALWDWAFGTLYVPRERETLTFGLGGTSGQPHPTLRAAYLEPFWAVTPDFVKRWIAAATGTLSGSRR